MAELPFKIYPFDNADKEIAIQGPDGLIIAVDYDDVDHEQVAAQAQRMVRILNTFWEENG